METLDGKIEALVRRNEGIGQGRAVELLSKETTKVPRTIEEHLRRLDGRTVKQVRSGREVHLYSMENWRRLEQQTHEARASHTRALKEVLGAFLRELPRVDELGLRLSLGPESAPFVSGTQPEYEPGRALDIEGHPLFEDLLDHLGLLSPAFKAADRWSAFRKEAAEFVSAKKELWALCEASVGRAFGLPIGNSAGGDELSVESVALLYGRAMAAVGGEERNPLRDLTAEAGRVEVSGPHMYYRKGVVRLVGRTLQRAGSPRRFQRWVEGNLQKVEQEVEAGDFREAARRLIEAVDSLRRARQGLVQVLEESVHYEVFPGSCGFVRTVN